MCKKAIIILLVCVLIFANCINGFSLETGAKAYVLCIAGSNEIILSENADMRLPIASTTKIMTSIIAIEYGNLDAEITVSEDTLKVEGTSMGLLSGDSVSLYELVCGMLLSSGNDAAQTAAVAVSGSIDAFLDLMNEKARELCMNNTHFSTVSGLDDEEHYSSAHDMAILASYALENDVFRSICSSQSITVTYGNPPYSRRLSNHNKLLGVYDGTIGVKTGFTKKSGRCLVSAAGRDGCTLICVTLNDSDDWNDHQKLLDYGFENVKREYLNAQNVYNISVGGGDLPIVQATPACEPCFCYFNNSEYRVETEIESRIFAPAKRGDCVGTVRYYYPDGKLIADVPVTLTQDVNCNTLQDSVEPKKGFFDWIKSLF